MATILLHIQKNDRRETLARALGDDHEVLRRDPSTTAERQEDLLILDHATLQRSGHGALSTYKMDDPRPESPILLLVPSSQTGTLPSTVWTAVDEVVEIPVRWPEMRNRIQVLVRMQEHAREVEQFRQLAAKYKVMLETQQRRLSGYKTLFQKGTCGALVVEELTIVEANSQAEDLFGIDDLVGTSLASLLPSQPSEKSAEEDARALIDLVKEGSKRVEWEFMRLGGETFSTSILLQSLRFGGEECVQVLFLDECKGTAASAPTRIREQ